MNFPEVSIGREQSMNTFALPDPGISSHHATLRWNSGMLTITDDGSTNGTSVGNIRLTAAKPHPLQPGDRIQLGSSTLVVELPGRA
jgi:pSer/pThr/pTyr-binding forkhead associated (FHA) protein